MIKQIGQYVENSTEHTIGTDLFIGYKPETAPDDCVAVLETGGGKPDFYHSDYAEKLIQVMARGSTYFTARGIAVGIFDALHAKKGITLPSVDDKSYYVNVIEAIQVPQYLGQDEKGRFLFSTNFIFRIQDV
jgi:hypothetical protein